MNAETWLVGVGLACVGFAAQAGFGPPFNAASRMEVSAQATSPPMTWHDEQRGAQGMGRYICSSAVGTFPEIQLGTPSAQEQFRDTLRRLQDQNGRSLQQSDQEILYLENRVATNEAETARRERELSGLKLKPAPTPTEKVQQKQAQNRTRDALERARIEREQLKAELGRRRHEREQLAQHEKELRQLESEYEADPGRADELMQGFR